MGVISYEHEESSTIAPARLFKSFILDADNLIPLIVPGAFKSLETLEGDGGVGTIKLITFGEGSPFKCAKHRIDEIDRENHVYKYSVIEGDVLEDNLDSISYVVKVEPGPDGGSICKTISTYHTKKDDHHITEDKIKAVKEKAKALFKLIEAHLHANPHAYN